MKFKFNENILCIYNDDNILFQEVNISTVNYINIQDKIVSSNLKFRINKDTLFDLKENKLTLIKERRIFNRSLIITRNNLDIHRFRLCMLKYVPRDKY